MRFIILTNQKRCTHFWQFVSTRLPERSYSHVRFKEKIINCIINSTVPSEGSKFNQKADI